MPYRKWNSKSHHYLTYSIQIKSTSHLFKSSCLLKTLKLSNLLYNDVLFYIKQYYFFENINDSILSQTFNWTPWNTLYHKLVRRNWFQGLQLPQSKQIETFLKKHSKYYNQLHSQTAQWVVHQALIAFEWFFKLIKAYKEGKIKVFPKIPQYKKVGSLNVAHFPWKSSILQDWGVLRLSTKNTCQEFTFIQTWLKDEEIKEVIVCPSPHGFKVSIVYIDKEFKSMKEWTNSVCNSWNYWVLWIDLWVSNLEWNFVKSYEGV